jgi:hypothetical protein
MGRPIFTDEVTLAHATHVVDFIEGLTDRRSRAQGCSLWNCSEQGPSHGPSRATISLIPSEVLPFCNCMEASGILHGSTLVATSIVEIIGRCIHKQEKKDEQPPPPYEPLQSTT